MEGQNKESIKELILSGLTWYNYLLSKWKMLVLLGLLGGAIGLSYSLLKKKNYTAKLTFALEEKSSANNLSNIASQFGLEMGGGQGGAFAGDNILELLRSRYLIEKTLLTKVNINGTEDLLINRYIEFNKLRERWADKPNLANLKYLNGDREAFSLQQDSVLWEIYKVLSKGGLNVSKIDNKLNIVVVRFKSRDEIFAKLFCERLVKNVGDFYIETKTSKSKTNINHLQFRVDSVKRELDAALYGRAELGDQNLGIVRQRAAVPKMKQEMRVQMLGTMYGELIKNLEFSKLALMREEPLIEIIDRPIYPLENDRLGKAKGIVIFGFLFGFLGVIYLVIKRFIMEIMS